MTDDQLKQARALCEKATVGPWKTSPDSGHIYASESDWWTVANAHTDGTKVCSRRYEYQAKERADASFIAASRTLIPQLLDLVEQQRREIESWKRRAEQHGCDVEKGDHECG